MKISYILPITTSQGPRLISTQVGLGYLKDTLYSTLKQSVPNWELIVISQKQYQRQVARTLNECIESLPAEFQSYAKKNTFLKIVTSKNLAKSCNEGLALSKGKFVANIQLGDQIADHTTYEIIKAKVASQKLQFAYTDQDYLNHLGERQNPFTKPDLSPDFLYCQNYIGSFGIFDRLMLKKLGGWNEKYEYAYDYDLNLRVIDHLNKSNKSKNSAVDTIKITNIPEVLYHQRFRKNNAKNKFINIRPTLDLEKIQGGEGLRVVTRHLKKNNNKIKIEQIKTKLYRHFWPIPKPEPLVSLIIPTRDGYEILKACVSSILQKTTYTNYEVLIVDNQSKDPRVLSYFKELSSHHNNIRILTYNKPFNYSALNNYAVSKAKGSILGFINNDTEVITPDWLSIMVSHAIRPEIGAVGAMLYYPDGSIQHAGVKIEGKIVDNAFKGESEEKDDQKMNLLSSIRNPPAVTAACLIVGLQKFMKVKGFNSKRLKIAFNDVDLCLKLNDVGYINLITPAAQMYHGESISRGSDDSEERKLNSIKEINFLRRKWNLKL